MLDSVINEKYASPSHFSSAILNDPRHHYSILPFRMEEMATNSNIDAVTLAIKVRPARYRSHDLESCLQPSERSFELDLSSGGNLRGASCFAVDQATSTLCLDAGDCTCLYLRYNFLSEDDIAVMSLCP